MATEFVDAIVSPIPACAMPCARVSATGRACRGHRRRKPHLQHREHHPLARRLGRHGPRVPIACGRPGSSTPAPCPCRYCIPPCSWSNPPFQE